MTVNLAPLLANLVLFPRYQKKKKQTNFSKTVSDGQIDEIVLKKDYAKTGARNLSTKQIIYVTIICPHLFGKHWYFGLDSEWMIALEVGYAKWKTRSDARIN